MKRATLQAALVAALMLTPPLWLVHAQHAAAIQRAAQDRAAWCAAHPEQEAGPEQCYLHRSAQP